MIATRVQLVDERVFDPIGRRAFFDAQDQKGNGIAGREHVDSSLIDAGQFAVRDLELEDVAARGDFIRDADARGKCDRRIADKPGKG